MLLCIVPMLLATPGPQPAGIRSQALDSLAADILLLGHVPEGGRLLVLAASNGWPGLLGGVSSVEPGFAPDSGAFSGRDTYRGECVDGGRGVLVTAPEPTHLPVGLPFRTACPGELEFRIEGPEGFTVMLSTPSLSVARIPPGPDGLYRIEAVERGVHWIEAVTSGSGSPRVLMLLPLLCGVTLEQVLSGEAPLPSSGASDLDGVMEEIDILRERAGLPGLARSGHLDGLARSRAVEIAVSGDVWHPDGLDSMLGGRFPAYAENIGRGSGLDEAWSMILTSPAHLEACLGADYDSVGLGAAVEIEGDGWQLVTVQLFTAD